MSSKTIIESTAIGDERVTRALGEVAHALGEPVCFVVFLEDGSMKAYHLSNKVASVEKNDYSGFLIYKLKDGGAIAIGKPKEPKGLVYSYYKPGDDVDNGPGPSQPRFPFS